MKGADEKMFDPPETNEKVVPRLGTALQRLQVNQMVYTQVSNGQARNRIGREQLVKKKVERKIVLKWFEMLASSQVRISTRWEGKVYTGNEAAHCLGTRLDRWFIWKPSKQT